MNKVDVLVKFSKYKVVKISFSFLLEYSSMLFCREEKYNLRDNRALNPIKIDTFMSSGVW